MASLSPCCLPNSQQKVTETARLCFSVRLVWPLGVADGVFVLVPSVHGPLLQLPVQV